jgi:hypothetical protein
MNTALKLSGYGLGMLALFGAAIGIGSAVAPGTVAENPAVHAATTVP